MKVFVTGVNGQLGHDVMLELKERGFSAIGSGSAEACRNIGDPALPYIALDITDADAVRESMMELRTDAVVHCAAWTAVDAAEDAENRERVFALNCGGTENIARACAAVGAKMIYISTDYVFDGRGERP